MPFIKAQFFAAQYPQKLHSDGYKKNEQIVGHVCLFMKIEVFFPKFGSFVTIPTNTLNQGNFFLFFYSINELFYFSYLFYTFFQNNKGLKKGRVD